MTSGCECNLVIIRILKFTGRWAFRAVIVLVVLVAALVLLKDRIFQSWVVGRLEDGTGLQVSLKRAEVDIFSGRVRFEGLKLYNPTEFGTSAFIHFEELQVEADRAAFKQRRLQFRLLLINLAELNIVEDKGGQLNLQAIKEQIDRKQKEAKPGKPSDDKPKLPMEFGGIETLKLTLSKVRKINLNYPDKPVETDLDIRDHVMTDIKTQEDFQNKVLPVLLRGGVAVIYQIWMESKHRQIPAP